MFKINRIAIENIEMYGNGIKNLALDITITTVKDVIVPRHEHFIFV